MLARHQEPVERLLGPFVQQQPEAPARNTRIGFTLADTSSRQGPRYVFRAGASGPRCRVEDGAPREYQFANFTRSGGLN